MIGFSSYDLKEKIRMIKSDYMNIDKADQYYMSINSIYINEGYNELLDKVSLNVNGNKRKVRDLIDFKYFDSKNKEGLKGQPILELFKQLCEKYDISIYIYSVTHDFKDDLSYKTNYYHYLTKVSKDSVEYTLISRTFYVEEMLIYVFPNYYYKFIKEPEELNKVTLNNENKPYYISEITAYLYKNVASGVVEDYYLAQSCDVFIEEDEEKLGLDIINDYFNVNFISGITKY